MDPNEEIENLELDPDATQEIADEGIEEPIEDYSESAQSKTGYKGNKYHVDRINELNEKSDKLKEKVEGLKEEKAKNWKLKDPKDDGPVKADGSNTRLKTKGEKLGDNARLAHAKAQEKINKVQRMKAKLDRATDMAAHPLEAAKEAAEDKAKDVAKKAGKKTAKAAAKTAGKVAKAAGRLVAAGGKAIIGFLASNPIALAIIGIVAILFVILGLLFARPSDGEIETEGYFDTTCDFNLTSVEFNICGSSTVKTMGLKEYVLSVVYGELEVEDFSEAAIKALMIIVKTNALANGNYDSSGNKVVRADDCGTFYDNVYEELPDEDENEAKKAKVKLLEEYYNEIESFLYISESFTEELTQLGSESALRYDDDVFEQLADTTENDYEKILDEIYGVENGSSDNETIVTSKPTIFVGDSRTVGMDSAVSDLKTENVVAEISKGYNWFVDTAISKVSQKVENESHNIVIWLGVNDLHMEGDYFNKYKELAEGEWSKHTIYIVSVGPLNNDNNSAVDDFNDDMHKDINNANISNLKYIDLGLTRENMDWNGCNDGIHYGNAAYQNIYDDISSHVTKNLSKVKALYNNSEYCSYYRFRKECEVGWWYPIGASGSYNRGDIIQGDPALLDTGPDNWGWRIDPVYGGRAYHAGSDLSASLGLNVVASRSGTVISVNDGARDCGADCGSGYGNFVVIDHGDGYFTRYGHLKKDSVTKYVSVGMTVSQGQIIGLSGNSGKSTGPHLHFEIREGNSWGTSLNPFDYISTSNPRPIGKCVDNYTSDAVGVCQALKDRNLSNNAIAGLLVNIYHEGAFKTNNLEDCYETNKCCTNIASDYGYCGTGYLIGNYGSDEAYTEGVSSGAYQNFTRDRAGYGLIQWTSSDRKRGLLDYYQTMKSAGKSQSIADVSVQIGYLMQELDSGSYSSARNTVYNPNASASQVAYDFCYYFERPANTSTTCSARSSSSELTNYLNLAQSGCK